MSRLGQLLIRAELVTENHLARALGVQHFAGGRLGTLLLERGAVAEDDIGRTLALQHGCEPIAWSVLGNVPPPTIACLPPKFAIRHFAIPFERAGGHLRVALRDPADLRILDELYFVTGHKIIAAVAPEVRIFHALEKYYGERRTPRFAILAEKLSRPTGRRPSRPVTLPPPPDFFASESDGTSVPAAPQEIWSEAADAEAAPPIIQSWKMPDVPLTPWAPPVADSEEPSQEVISWEEMSPPSLWIPEPTEEQEEPPFLPRADSGEDEASRAETAPSPAGAPPASPSPPTDSQPPGIPAPSPSPPEAAPPPLPPPPRPAPPPAPEAKEAALDDRGASRRTGVPRPARPAIAFDFAGVSSASGRDGIASAVLAALGERFGRAALFVARADRVCGLAATGKDIDAGRLLAIEIPWSEPSVFLNLRLSRGFYLGPLPPLARHRAIAEAVGRWPEECLVQPVVMKDKPVAFLYTDFERDRGATPLDLAFLRELAKTMAAAFAGSIRSSKREAI